MQHLEVSGVVRYIYIYIYIYIYVCVCVCVCVIRRLKVKRPAAIPCLLLPSTIFSISKHSNAIYTCAEGRYLLTSSCLASCNPQGAVPFR